jgi:hypothetical protein
MTDGLSGSRIPKKKSKTFLQDERIDGKVPAQVLSNFPSRNWKEKKNDIYISRFVQYVLGALSLNTMYSEAFVQ